jgi:HAD superfamily hydrolase (TIGR01450 family)
MELRFSSIDGVLLRSSKPLPGASETLRYLQAHRIPFILLTNGGGKTEAQRVADLSKYLDVPIDESMFVQSHTPFTQLVEGHKNRADLKDACVLVLGGEGNDCRHIAEK